MLNDILPVCKFTFVFDSSEESVPKIKRVRKKEWLWEYRRSDGSLSFAEFKPKEVYSIRYPLWKPNEV